MSLSATSRLLEEAASDALLDLRAADEITATASASISRLIRDVPPSERWRASRAQMLMTALQRRDRRSLWSDFDIRAQSGEEAVRASLALGASLLRGL